MKLHYSPASPYARKVVMVAIEAGVDQAISIVTTSVVPHDPNLGLAASNPLMKVPTLERDDGTTLYDSAVICEYLDSLGGGRVFPAGGEARWQSLRRHALADGVMDAAILLRYETALRPEPMRWPAWIAGQHAKIDNALDAFEAEVERFPTAFEIGQIGLVAALGYLDFRFAAHPWRPGRPRLDAWFARLAARESVKRSVPVG
jgi:glutathione S-transferase